MDQVVYGPFISREQAKAQGLKHFFTGKPCKRGHLDTRCTCDGKCRECIRLRYEAKKPSISKICPVCDKSFLCGTGTRKTTKAICCSDACNIYRQNHLPGKQELRNVYRRSHRANNLHKERAYQNKKYRQDPQFAITRNLRSRIGEVLRFAKDAKRPRSSELIGCTGVFLMQHLKDQFLPEMNWDNYGAWHIDHIRPCASFDLTDPEQQKQCFHYTNLQPLWAAENLAKSDKWDEDDETESKAM